MLPINLSRSSDEMSGSCAEALPAVVEVLAEGLDVEVLAIEVLAVEVLAVGISTGKPRVSQTKPAPIPCKNLYLPLWVQVLHRYSQNHPRVYPYLGKPMGTVQKTGIVNIDLG